MRARGWAVHCIVDVFPADAQDIPDEEWIAHGLDQSWVPLSKEAGSRHGTWRSSTYQTVRRCSSTSTTNSCAASRWSNGSTHTATRCTGPLRRAVPPPMPYGMTALSARGRDGGLPR
ncbi:hypothetical protein [Streptomyces sp. ISL-1]|uniref:hypothetical protein n=1 Tax=Streptomyces sp. ISL-1 TaxID=2817657 RepID=UPI0020352A6C|nr:hypothetical protein [Streptomyces sp. ISL-1]